MKLSANFLLSEFQSKDGAIFPEDVIENLKELAFNLQIIRDHINKPIHINSGYRSPKHNKSIGGAKNSYHLKGMAGDLMVKGMKPKELFKVIAELIEKGEIKQGGLSEYSSFVHYDCRGYKARW